MKIFILDPMIKMWWGNSCRLQSSEEDPGSRILQEKTRQDQGRRDLRLSKHFHG